MEEAVKGSRRIWDVLSFHFRKAAPYLLILVASLIALYVWLFFDFITGGDDVAAHLTLVGDLLYGFNHGFYDSTGHLIFGDFAYDPYMFYGHLPHILAAGYAFLFQWMGARAIDGLKAVALASVFVSGVYTYWLSLRITKSGPLSLSFGLAYVFMPYRLFCFFYRFAYSEAVAMAFIPVFFYGLYRLLNDGRVVPATYVSLVLASVFLLMSHPFTALITAGSGIIYLLFNAKKALGLFKNPKKAAACAASLLLIFLCTAYWLIPMAIATESGEYVVSDEEAMWTTVSDLIYRLYQTNQFSGFINFDWLDVYGSGAAPDTKALWGVGLAVYPVCCLAVYGLDLYLEKKLPRNKWTSYFSRVLVSVFVFVIVLILGQQRIELYMASGLFLLGMFYFRFSRGGERNPKLSRGGLEKDYLQMAKTPDFWCFLVLSALSLLFLYGPFMWEHAPAILRMAQFPFRFWGLCMFCLLMVLLHLARPFAKSEHAGTIGLALATMVFVLSQGPIDKRIFCIEGNGKVYGEPDAAYFQDYRSWGTANEYLPKIIVDIANGDAESEYGEESLVYVAAEIIVEKKGGLPFGLGDYISPVFLTGYGEAVATMVKTPEADFEIRTDGGILQIPHIYYRGYIATAVYGDGLRENLGTFSADGLVAIELPEGEYRLEVRYPGPLEKRVLFPFSVVSFLGLPAWLLAPSLAKKIRRRKTSSTT